MFPNNRMSFSVYIEGNLGAGKTTLLEKIESQLPLLTMEWVAKTFPEPVAEWEKVGSSESNLLKLMYESPKEHSFSFKSQPFCKQNTILPSLLLTSLIKNIFAFFSIDITIKKEGCKTKKFEFEIKSEKMCREK